MEDELDAKAATNGNPPLTNGTQTSSNLPIPSSNAYQPGRRAQIVFQTEEEIKEAKHHRHQARKMAATIQDKHNQTQLSLQEMHEIRQRSLQDAALRDGLPVKVGAACLILFSFFERQLLATESRRRGRNIPSCVYIK